MPTPFHDPLILPMAQGYLGLSTDLGWKNVTARTSPDLLSWSEPFSLLPETPASIRHRIGTDHFWAPELVQRGDTWRLYYCASRPGKTQSTIGLAVSKTIDGPYENLGDVVTSTHLDTVTQPNAIDPCVIADRDGTDYLIYGSFFGGIRILPLKADGFPAVYDGGKCIAGGNHQAIEGAYAYYQAEQDRYVLFTSWGDLGKDYHVRVGYSRDITGPYLDSNGLPLTDLDPNHHPGDKLCGGYNFDLPSLPGVMATGHNSLLTIGDALYMVHHARPEGDVRHPFLQIRRLLTASDGRLMAWPLPYDGHPLAPATDTPRVWHVCHQSRLNRGVSYARTLTDTQLLLTRTGDDVQVTLYGREWQGKLYQQGNFTAMTLISPDGESLWGIGE